ncbi:MAG TPA: MMPL family transporter [Chitinophagaceae bacterium]|nr:MMPL family transporter [Chitinophagaceae bacterium]
MWQRLAGFVLKFRIPLLIGLFAVTGILTYKAIQVELSYDFVKAIPVNNPKYQQYLSFKKEFGEDGNLLVIGIKTDQFFHKDFFDAYCRLANNIKNIASVENVLSIPTAVNLIKNDSTHRLAARQMFAAPPKDQPTLDSLKQVFLSLPFYRGLLYNPSTGAYLMAIRVNKEVINSSARVKVISAIQQAAYQFGQAQNVKVHLSGLPLIRTVVTEKIAHELRIFLLFSFLLTAFILFGFFRSFSAVVISMVVVVMGVIWSLATVVLLGYKLTLLTGLIPPLIVVIGIPNCVYFLNKYHSEYAEHGNKIKALVRMVQQMGIVTLFTNLAAAIGFGVFFFTRSAILKEFGIVAGLNIMFIFLISFVFLPTVLSFLPAPRTKHTSYLDSRPIRWVLLGLEKLVFKYRPGVYVVAGLVVVFAFIGIWRLNSVGYIVDDIPHSDKIYKDLRFFETNFHGVMPLEILVDTKHKQGISRLSTLRKLDTFTGDIAAHPEFSRPLSLVEGIKFARQAYYLGDSSDYAVPNQFDIAFLAPYLQMRGGRGETSNFSKLLSSFMDSTHRIARISVEMADIGTARLPGLIDSLKKNANEIFDTAHYKVTFTGTSIIFLEGSTYIINGLIDSIILAFILIVLCMLYLFRSWKMLFISLIPNMIPLIVTAGVMGWVGVPLKPSTVLVFSIALGISIDVTIRFLVNFKQELHHHRHDISSTVRSTIHNTGLSIILTGLILFAGFMIFCFSGFGGTRALGWLTSLTLILAMITNLTILPALLLWMEKSLLKKAEKKEPLWDSLDDEDVDLHKLGLDKLETKEDRK